MKLGLTNAEMDDIELSLSRRQLVILAGALNEAIELIDDWEFETQLGTDKDTARNMRSELSILIAAALRSRDGG